MRKWSGSFGHLPSRTPTFGLSLVAEIPRWVCKVQPIGDLPRKCCHKCTVGSEGAYYNMEKRSDNIRHVFSFRPKTRSICIIRRMIGYNWESKYDIPVYRRASPEGGASPPPRFHVMCSILIDYSVVTVEARLPRRDQAVDTEGIGIACFSTCTYFHSRNKPHTSPIDIAH